MRIRDWSSDVCSSDLHLLAVLVEQRAHAAVLHAADQVIALGQLALLHQHRRHRAAALVQRGFDHDARGAPLGHGLELQHFGLRSEEHTSELQSLMRISYAVFCLKKKQKTTSNNT